MTTVLDVTNNVLPNGKVKVPPKPKARQPIRVNDAEISADDVQSEAQNHPAETPVQAFEQAARALVVRELLRQESIAKGIIAEAEGLGEGLKETDEDAAIRVLLEQEVTVPDADESNCLRYYENHLSKFCSETLYEARHILFAASPSDESARKTAKLAADSVIVELQADRSKFAVLALTLSACTSKEQGGNLGQLTKGSTVPEFENVLFTLKEGELSAEPVATQYGYHVIQLDRIIVGEVLPFELVQERIAAWLEAASWSRAVSQYIGILVGKSKIVGIDLEAADGPLVQ
ncbi:MAG: peptidylprolyl isomerase [Rhizobiaceae bacterium]|nr:peptidylprolyl isomerase [Rhizobiaceae bacterium]